MKMRFILSLVIALVYCGSVFSQSIESRIDDLLAKMTTEEKIGQLTLFTSGWDVTGPTLNENYKEDLKAGKVGALFNAHGAEYTRDLQKIAVGNSPSIWIRCDPRIQDYFSNFTW